MNCKNIKYYGFIILLIASAQLFTSCSKANKDQQNNSIANQKMPAYERIKLSSKEFMQYCDLVITADSAGIYVQKGDSILYRHLMPKGYFTDCIVYDRLTGYISYNQCTKIGCEKGFWNYELKLWDFKRDKEWAFNKDKSSEGAGNNSLTMINYNEKENTGLLIKDYGDGTHPYYYENGIETDFKGGDEYTSVEAILPDKEYLVILDAEASDDGGRYTKYSLKKGEFVNISESEFLKYKDLMLKQFGSNYSVHISDKLRMYKLNWNSQGTAYVALRPLKPGDYKNHSFCIYSNSKIYDLISDKETLIPIWK